MRTTVFTQLQDVLKLVACLPFLSPLNEGVFIIDDNMQR